MLPEDLDLGRFQRPFPRGYLAMLALFGGVPVAGTASALNWRRLGMGRRAWAVLGWTALASSALPLAVAACLLALGDEGARPWLLALFIGYVAGGPFFVLWLTPEQGAWVEEHAQRGGRIAAPIWLGVLALLLRKFELIGLMLAGSVLAALLGAQG